MADQSMGLETMLDQCLEAMAIQGQSVEACAARYPADRERLIPLLAVAQRLGEARSIGPSAAFRQQAATRLRARLTARPAMTQAKARPAPRWRLAPALAALAIVIGLAATTTGTIYAAGNSLPGETLYPVELAVEQARLSVTPPGKALGLKLEFADKRLREAEKLADKGDDTHIPIALDHYDQLANEMASMADASAPGEDIALQALNAKLADHQARLEALLARLPEAARPGISRAIEASKHGQEQAAKALQKHQGGGKPDNVPGGKPDSAPGGGKPDNTPGGQGGGSNSGGGNSATCANGSSLAGSLNGKAHQLAAKYNTPYETVRDLLCSGLTLQEVEAQLAAGTPASP